MKKFFKIFLALVATTFLFIVLAIYGLWHWGKNLNEIALSQFDQNLAGIENPVEKTKYFTDGLKSFERSQIKTAID